MKSHFHNKIISLLVLLSLCLPMFSNAIMIVPEASLTIIVNTQGEDALFNLNLEDNYSGWQVEEQIQAQTQNLTFSKTTYIISFYDHRVTQAAPVGWKLQNTLCFSDDPANTFSYQPNGVVITPKAWTNITCTFNNKKVVSKTPVLIVPGIMGTEMFNGTEKLWADVARMMNPTNNDSFMDPLAFNKDLTPSDLNLVTGSIIGSPIATKHFYDLLLNEFVGQGYIENETLFTFPYDWRYGVSGKFADPSDSSGQVTNSDLLKEKIESILAETGAEKVDVVAHSMGGLIVKKYVMENAGDANAGILSSQKINKAVFVGVPNLGAPEAVKTLIQGSDMGIPFLNDEEVKKISENMPGAYDLLPSQAYYSKVGSFVETVDMPNMFDLSWQFGDKAVVKNLNYAEFENYLTQDKNLNNQAFNDSETLHAQTFDDYDLRVAGVNIFSINGCKTATMSSLTQTKDTNIFGKETTSYKNVKFIVGDGTVPITSASNLPIDSANKYYALKADHGKMPSQDGIRQEIVNLISGSNLDTGKDFWGGDLITQDVTKCELNGKVVGIFSPVNILVTDEFGNKLGLAEDGSIINEIPGADFQIWGDSSNEADKHKFLFLPTDNAQTYTISLIGTGVGTFTIKTQDVLNSLPSKIENFINIPVTTELTGQINFGVGESQTTLTLKQNPSAETQVIYPSAVLTAEQLNDFTSPASIAEFNDSNVKITATDDNSGVLEVQYNLDDAGFLEVKASVVNFVVSQEGKHKIVYFAIDKNANTEIEKILEFEIKFLPPVITLVTAITGVGGVNMAMLNNNQPKTQATLPLPIPQPEPQEIIKKVIVKENTTPNFKPQNILPKKVASKNTGVLPLQNILPEKEEIISPQNLKQPETNTFLASSSNSGNWFSRLWQKIIGLFKK